MNFLLLLFVTISLMLCSSATKLPSIFMRCSSKDMSCLKDSIQDAVPKLKDGIEELGIPSLDPILIPKMSIGASNIVKLTQHYKNANCYGLSSGKVNDVSLDLKKGKLVIGMESPLAEMNASYTAKGKILILDVYGNGQSMIRLERVDGTFSCDLETYTKNNQKFLKATNSNLVLRCEHAVYQFGNLFNGNEMMGDNINKVLNDNWKEIYDELGPGYMKAIGISLLNLINKFFAKIPLEELFLN